MKDKHLKIVEHENSVSVTDKEALVGLKILLHWMLQCEDMSHHHKAIEVILGIASLELHTPEPYFNSWLGQIVFDMPLHFLSRLVESTKNKFTS